MSPKTLGLVLQGIVAGIVATIGVFMVVLLVVVPVRYGSELNPRSAEAIIRLLAGLAFCIGAGAVLVSMKGVVGILAVAIPAVVLGIFGGLVIIVNGRDFSGFAIAFALTPGMVLGAVARRHLMKVG